MAPAELNFNFIINPRSGNRDKTKLIQTIKAFALKKNISHRINLTEYPGHARQIAKSLASENQVIIAVGGDGTIHEVADGIQHSPACLGLLPAGSGNGLARHLGVKMKIEAALNQLIDSEIVKMDLLEINKKLSVNIAGVGFDGFIARNFSMQSSRGLSGYFRLIWSTFLKYNEFDFTLESDGQTNSGSAFIIAFCNGSQYGNQANIAPNAQITDGLMDVVVIRKPQVIQIPGLLFQVVSGKLKSNKLIQCFRTRALKITPKEPIDLQLDGEYEAAVQDIVVRIKPSALNILRPL